MPPRMLIFGGTFDPPHRAHAVLPPLAARELGCDRILYVPAALNPLKRDHPPAPEQHRLAMLKLALREVHNAEIWTGELDRARTRGGVSYTIETLHELARTLPRNPELRLLIGCDQALEFHRWKDWETILKLATPAVMLRPPWDRESFCAALLKQYDEAEARQWLDHVVQVPRLEVSASAVRGRLARGERIDDLLDPAVAEYIRSHRLYRQASESGQ